MRAPCHRSRIRGFIDPHAPEHSLRAAIRICETCPIRKECARDALTSGTSLDGDYTAPATAVVQAGIICHGDQDTARALAAIAGVRPPRYRKRGTRPRPASHCINCEQPMVPWTRGEVPAGHVMHYAKSYCTNCRDAYTQARNATVTKQRPVMRKHVDRKRHHPETAAARARSAHQRGEITAEELHRVEARAPMTRQRAQRLATAAGFELTSKEAADLAGVGRDAIARRVQDGYLTRYRPEGWKGCHFYSRAEVIALPRVGTVITRVDTDTIRTPSQGGHSLPTPQPRLTPEQRDQAVRTIATAAGYDITVDEAVDLARQPRHVLTAAVKQGMLTWMKPPRTRLTLFRSSEITALFPATDRNHNRATLTP